MLKVSVIIPIYNVEKYLAACLESVLSQDLDEMELLCVDDCSTDGSLGILREYASRDDRIRCLRTDRNRGISAARNLGLSMACGEYIAFVDSDDFLADRSLGGLYRQAKEKRLDVLYFRHSSVDENGIPTGTEIPRSEAPDPSVLPGPAVLERFLARGEWSCVVFCQLLRRDFLLKHGLRFKEGYIHEDEAFSFAAAVLAERALSVPVTAYRYRHRAGSIMTSSSMTHHYEGTARAFVDIAGWIERLNLTDWAAWRYLANMDYLMGIYQVSGEIVSKTAWQTEDIRLFRKYLPQTRMWREAESLSHLKLPEECSRVFLYGAGKVGRNTYRHLINSGQLENRRMGGFLVTQKSAETSACMGAPVIAIDEYNSRPGDAVLVTVGKTLQAQIILELEKRGLNYIL